MALGGVGRESEAESVRFHGRRVTKVGPEVTAFHPVNIWLAKDARLPSSIRIYTYRFSIEHHIFDRHLTEEEKKSLKEYQDVSSKVWAGVAAMLALLYFGQSGHGE